MSEHPTYDPLKDSNIGVNIDGYVLEERVGKGMIGVVYKARRTEDDVFACKVIPEDQLRLGWETELVKVHKLKSVPNVIEYKFHRMAVDKENRSILCIFWNFVDGINLRDYIATRGIDIAFVEDIGLTILNVLFACKQVGIVHGDLHTGNILISNPDPRLIENKQTIYISDFGYGGSHNNKTPKDDTKQFFSIINNLLDKLHSTSLTAEQRIWLEKMRFFLDKKVMETDPTQGNYVGKIDVLVREFKQLRVDAELEAARAKRGTELREPGDYLVAEALGYKAEEWKNLFVPEFLAANDLLSKNITVLTGARGCGKTMTFRRLTSYMDKVIGESSGVRGADEFIGFYLNCRSIVEAFPYIPNVIGLGLNAQIVHFFNLTWLAEICKTFSVHETDQITGYIWLEEFISSVFPSTYQPLPRGANILAHVRSFIEIEKERTRTADHGKDNRPEKWSLSRRDFLDQLTEKISANLSWAAEKPFFFFLDDYTIPTIPRSVQKILNPIIFKRRDNIFFKVSTESAISFERSLERNKPLELHQDFELIDLASESLHQDATAKKNLLEEIFKRRIERDEHLKGQSITLENLLGQVQYSSNEMARIMRERKSITYSGVEAFIGMWSSDIRIMIQMFVDMLRESDASLKSGQKTIAPNVQDKVFKNAGGEFLDFAEKFPNPSFLEKQLSVKDTSNYGTHLKNIVEAFITVSRHELLNGELISNHPYRNPKQAFRLEIVDHFKLDEDTKGYYEGLIRWHIFLQDRRGKSVRGMLTPRLFLNRVLLPHAQLTFSTHDHIHVSSQELNYLFKEPLKFLAYWKAKRKPNKDQQSMFKE